MKIHNIFFYNWNTNSTLDHFLCQLNEPTIALLIAEVEFDLHNLAAWAKLEFNTPWCGILRPSMIECATYDVQCIMVHLWITHNYRGWVMKVYLAAVASAWVRLTSDLWRFSSPIFPCPSFTLSKLRGCTFPVFSCSASSWLLNLFCGPEAGWLFLLDDILPESCEFESSVLGRLSSFSEADEFPKSSSFLCSSWLLFSILRNTSSWRLGFLFLPCQRKSLKWEFGKV